MEELLHPEWSVKKVEELKKHYEAILSLLGEDVYREGDSLDKSRSEPGYR